MAKGKNSATGGDVVIAKDESRKVRNFPKHTLEAALVLPQKIQDEMGGKPMNRLLLADGLGMSPSSSNFRDLLSSAYKYGLTEGTEKADFISLTALGDAATQQSDQSTRLRSLRNASMTPEVFGRFMRDYANKKLPSAEMLPKILRTQYSVPVEMSEECASRIEANGRFVDIVREIGGSPHILLEAGALQSAVSPPASLAPPSGGENGAAISGFSESVGDSASLQIGADTSGSSSAAATAPTSPKPIFVGHGKNKAPLHQLQRLLSSFQIPHKVAVDEANLGRPIPQKVKSTIEECGSAILIFTRDEKFHGEDGSEVWRPSENVVHELGATSFAYGDRIVIFKEKGIHFPTNFASIGYIEFDADDIAARTADLLKELIGFGLVRVTPT